MKKNLWIFCVIVIAALSSLFIFKQRTPTNMTRLYYQIYESDDKVFEICRKAHSKNGAEYDLSEVIAIEYICKCVVEENKAIFADAFKSLPTEQQKALDYKIDNLKEAMAYDVTPSVIICSSEFQDKGVEYFEHKYGKIKVE